MSLPAKRGRPILPKVRTKTASVMMVVDGCGNSLVKIELFHLFYCRDAVNLLQHNKHGLVVDCNKRIVFAPEQRCMAVADLCSVIVVFLCIFLKASCHSISTYSTVFPERSKSGSFPKICSQSMKTHPPYRITRAEATS